MVGYQQGVRLGCVASPHLFALYTEMIMRELDDMDGFRIGGTVVINLRCADDTVIITESEQELQCLINVVVTKSEEKGLYLNSAQMQDVRRRSERGLGSFQNLDPVQKKLDHLKHGSTEEC